MTRKAKDLQGSERLMENAHAKLVAKNLDMIVANDVTAPDAGFDVETNQVMILSREGGREELLLMSKAAVADAVLDRLLLLLADQPTNQKDEGVSR